MTTENRPPQPIDRPSKSPRWNWTVKLVVGLTLVAIAIGLLVQFQNFLGPLILAFILAYLFYPLANFLQKYIGIPWRLAVTLIYVVVVLVTLGLLTWGGLALFEQIQNLVNFIEENIDEIPALVSEFTQQTYIIGPFEFSLSGLNWNEIANEVVRSIQPVVGQVGSLAGSLATGAANIIFWVGVVLLVSYFLLSETEGIPNRFLNLRIPGYTEDIKRIGEELSHIWNAFIRGQIIVVIITVIIYTIFLGSMGIEFFFGLALVAALGRFVPYVGAWVTWITYGLVALLQGQTVFNLPSGWYALIILGVSMIIDSMLDNFLVPKVMSENLKVHPALVLVGALVAVDLLGLVGIILAAPVMATIKLFLDYVFHKLADQNPWEDLDNQEPPEQPRWVQFVEEKWNSFITWIKKIGRKTKNAIAKADDFSSDEETQDSDPDET
jgi:predicted PurR-regulated permease PerM